MSANISLGDGVGRAALVGSAIGFVTMTCVATSMGLIGGLTPVDAFGIAAFAAVWGGPGFGGVFGAIIAIDRNERLAR